LTPAGQLVYGEFLDGGNFSRLFQVSQTINMTSTANRTYRWLFWSLAIIGFCLDQGSKYSVFGWLYPSETLSRYSDQSAAIVPGVFYLATTFSDKVDPGDSWRSPLRTLFGTRLPKLNHGALWGIGSAEDGTDLNHLFALVSIVAAIAIVVWSFRPSIAGDCWLCIALGLILAGTLGNLYDRVVFLGVRDFLQWVYLYEWPRFNIADSCLVCGAGILLVHAFFTSPATVEKPATATSVPTESAALATEPLP
jgi:lipoprotein signal peptidase